MCWNELINCSLLFGFGDWSIRGAKVGIENY